VCENSPAESVEEKIGAKRAENRLFSEKKRIDLISAEHRRHNGLKVVFRAKHFVFVGYAGSVPSTDVAENFAILLLTSALR
jgi:hypothetical protein